MIVLAEDKSYYPAAETVYGKDVETMIEEEDHQPITKPIIEPVVEQFNQIVNLKVPKTFYSDEYLCQMLAKPALSRSIALVGHLHHGKTSLSDMLLQASYEEKGESFFSQRQTDSRQDEVKRQLSIKAVLFQVLL